MSIVLESAAVLIRSFLIGAVSVALVFPARHWLRRTIDEGKYLPLALWTAVLFSPPVLTGYVYGNLSYFILDMPRLKLAIYLTLILLRFLPVTLLLFTFVPSPVSEQALFCSSLLPKKGNRFFSRIKQAGFVFRCERSRITAALCLSTLFAFTEFETASLLTVQTWSVTLFDSFAGGIAVGEMFRNALFPAFCMMLLLFPVLYGVFARKAEFTRFPAGRQSVKRSVYSWILLCVSFSAVTLFPVLYTASDALRGMKGLVSHSELASDTGFSIFIAVCASAGAYAAARFLTERRKNKPAGITPVLIVILPGMFGSLILAVSAVQVFRLPVLSSMYNTLVPLLSVLVLSVLPYAVLLAVLCRNSEFRRALFCAELGTASGNPRQAKRFSSLVRNMKFRRDILIWLLLFTWTYFEIQASALLAPPGSATVFVLLYNLMHYGRSSVLSAMFMVSCAVPALLFCALFISGYILKEKGTYDGSAVAG